MQIENQARVCHSSTVVGLGTSFGRGASSTLPGDLQNSDLIVLEGSNMAEAHPVAYQWVVEAKARGATVIHVDPHYSRTSALADMFVPLRAGSDIAFLGGVINHVLSTESDFREYVLAYTNAPTIIGEEFEDVGADGLFSGFDEDKRGYDPASWQYEGTIVAAAAGQRDQEGNPQVLEGEGEGGGEDAAAQPADARSDAAAPALRVADPQAPLRAVHAGDGRARLRRAAGDSSRRSASCSSRTRGASARRRSCTGSAGRSTRSARSTSARPRCCSSCSATWVARAAA